ncbi:MAG: ABC transporter ATP-binding protein [Gemmatimonadota bacterium]
MSQGLDARIVVRRSEDFTLQLDLFIPPGRTVALLGPNGAGKSTAVAALAGLLPLDSGRIELSGRVLDDPVAGIFVPPESRRVGVVFQDALLFPHMTVLENVAFGLRALGVGRHEARGRAREWLGRLGLEGLDVRRPGELSGGQAQRVGLARALAPEPGILLMDEPLSALDVTRRAEIRRVLTEHLTDFPGPRLVITHDPAEAFQLADEIHLLEGGVVTQVGSADDIRLTPRTAYAADLGGSNFFVGTARQGQVEIQGFTVAVADREIQGPVRVSIPPAAVSVHRDRPGGSPRNRWRTTLERVEDDGLRARLLTGPPLPLMIQVTPEALRELELRTGAEVWVSVKASEVRVERRFDAGRA